MTGADAPRCYHARTRCLFCWPDTDGDPPKAPPKRGHCAACGRKVGGGEVVAACRACAAKGAEARPLPARWPQRPPRRRRRPRTAS